MIIINQNQLTESSYRPWNYGEWTNLKGRKFLKLRLIIQGKMGFYLKNIQVVDGQNQLIDFKSPRGEGMMSIHFSFIDSVATAIDRGNKEPNWELRLTDNTSIYLDSAI